MSGSESFTRRSTACLSSSAAPWCAGLKELSYEQAARATRSQRAHTLRGRLYRGRQRLEVRLRARGLPMSAILPLGTPAIRLLAPVTPALVEATVQLSSKWFTIGPWSSGPGRRRFIFSLKELSEP